MNKRSFRVWVAIWVLAGCSFSAHGQNDSGNIDISSASIDFDGSTGLLRADVEIVLPPEVRNGLNSGVPLEFIVELRLLRPRGWLPAATLAKFQRRYSLIYYELTRHYRVRALDTDVSRNYRSLSPALDALGELRDVMIPISKELNMDLQLTSQASLGIKLDTTALPLPLQPVFSSTWRLSSKDYLWPIN